MRDENLSIKDIPVSTDSESSKHRRVKYIAFFGLMGLIFFFLYQFFATAVDYKALDPVFSQDPVIVDVRSPAEFNMGHIEGSVNYPLPDIESGKELNIEKGRAIVTCCSQGVRSVQAAQLLTKKGYKHVTDGGSWTNLEIQLENYQRSNESAN